MVEPKQVDSPSVPTPSAGLGGVALTVVSLVVSVLSYGALAGEMRIHWSLGGPHYGPEFAPAWLVLALFPVLVGGLAVGARQLRRFLVRAGEYESFRGYYDWVVVGVLSVVVLAQCLVVAANLA